ARLLDPDGDQVEAAVAGQLAPGRLDDGEHALGFRTVGEFAQDPLAHGLALRPVEELWRVVRLDDAQPGGARALDLARAFGEKEPAPPPLAALAQGERVLDARVVDRRDQRPSQPCPDPTCPAAAAVAEAQQTVHRRCGRDTPYASLPRCTSRESKFRAGTTTFALVATTNARSSSARTTGRSFSSASSARCGDTAG